MNSIETSALQRRLGLAPDGLFGRGTWTALFLALGSPPQRARELALAAHVHASVHDIWSPMRLAHFLAQLAHESGGFVYMEEIASGAAYEGRADLGNIQPGDGKRYKGRGPIQCTGRFNYREYGQRLGLAFEDHPEMLAYPSVGLLFACAFWQVKGLNALADADDLVAITKRINGGVNGLPDRRARLTVTKGLLL